jgi:hypothetical protein
MNRNLIIMALGLMLSAASVSFAKEENKATSSSEVAPAEAPKGDMDAPAVEHNKGSEQQKMDEKAASHAEKPPHKKKKGKGKSKSNKHHRTDHKSHSETTRGEPNKVEDAAAPQEAAPPSEQKN